MARLVRALALLAVAAGALAAPSPPPRTSPSGPAPAPPHPLVGSLASPGRPAVTPLPAGKRRVCVFDFDDTLKCGASTSQLPWLGLL